MWEAAEPLAGRGRWGGLWGGAGVHPQPGGCGGGNRGHRLRSRGAGLKSSSYQLSDRSESQLFYLPNGHAAGAASPRSLSPGQGQGSGHGAVSRPRKGRGSAPGDHGSAGRCGR